MVVKDGGANGSQVEHLLKDGIGVVEKFGVKAKLTVQTLCNIGDVAIFISNDVVLVKALVFGGRRFHVFKLRGFLNESYKDDPFIYLGINLNDKVDLLQVPLFLDREKLPLNLNHRRLGGFKVPLNNSVMDLCNRPWDNCGDIPPDEVLAVVSKHLLNLLIGMYDGPNLR